MAGIEDGKLGGRPRKARICPKCGKAVQTHRNGLCRAGNGKRRCRSCGKDPSPNYIWCKSCHGRATDSYADIVPV
jgi:NMD protein affecting ribosome stability and mRNA decay